MAKMTKAYTTTDGAAVIELDSDASPSEFFDIIKTIGVYIAPGGCDIRSSQHVEVLDPETPGGPPVVKRISKPSITIRNKKRQENIPVQPIDIVRGICERNGMDPLKVFAAVMGVLCTGHGTVIRQMLPEGTPRNVLVEIQNLRGLAPQVEGISRDVPTSILATIELAVALQAYLQAHNAMNAMKHQEQSQIKQPEVPEWQTDYQAKVVTTGLQIIRELITHVERMDLEYRPTSA